MVAPHYDSNIVMETWGRKPDEATCETFDIVSNLHVDFLNTFKYKYTKDHSKYGFTES